MAEKEKVTVSTSFPILEQYLNYLLAVKERSELTVREYRYDLVLFFRLLKKDKGLVSPDTDIKQISIDDVDEKFLQSITTDDIFIFLIKLSRERKASAANRARKVATLKSFFKYLYQRKKILSEDPAYELESPKIGKRLPKYLSLDESVQLLSTAEEKESRFQERDYCMITLFLNCGMRLSELTGINLTAIHGDTLTVIGKGNKERTIYLNEACMLSIEEWLAVRPLVGLREPDALFISRIGRRISTQAVQLSIKKLIADAGLDPKVYSVHKLRHTAATLMYKYGQVDIRSLQSILGHASVSTTQIYTHVDDEALRNAVSANPLAKIKPGTSDPK